jgi:hypothetical protein
MSIDIGILRSSYRLRPSLELSVAIASKAGAGAERPLTSHRDLGQWRQFLRQNHLLPGPAGAAYAARRWQPGRGLCPGGIR